MSIHPLLALTTPPEPLVAGGTVGLAGGDVLVAVVGFALLFVVFGTRPSVRSTDAASDAPGGCGTCDGGACGVAGCPAGRAASQDQEVA